jgi:hypothetical protein
MKKEKVMALGEIDKNTCMSTCVSRCKKDIYPKGKMNSQMEFTLSERSLDYSLSIENASSAREINLESSLIKEKSYLERDRILRNQPIQSLLASNYLSSSEPYIANLISKDNFNEILNVARLFPGNLTSFLGFECRLGEYDARADWAFAISGLNGDRYVLANLFKNGYFPGQLLDYSEWRQIRDFSKAWIDPNSILSDKVQCFWLEFDMPEESPEIPIPCVFFGPSKIPEGASVNDFTHYEWLTQIALPLLWGHPISKATESNLKKCIKEMPKYTSLFQVGTLLSRSSNGIRIYINKFQPEDVIPYLNTLGWFDETGEFTKLLDEIKDLADRFVLSFDVNEDGIGARVGIELSFESNFFQKETRWINLLNYLVSKGLCIPEKRNALIKYQGSENESSDIILEPVKAASENLNDLFLSTIVRYISHIKIVYQPEELLEAKAYPAVRLFEKSDEF